MTLVWEILGELFTLPLRFMWNKVIMRYSMRAVRELLEDLSIELDENPVADRDGSYWLVRFHMPKVNWLNRRLLKLSVVPMISVRVRFESSRGDRIHSDAYDVSNGWGQKEGKFTVASLSTMRLAIMRRDIRDLYLYPLSGSFANHPLLSTYDVLLRLRIEGTQDFFEPKHCRLMSVIKEGRLSGEL
jgi:hypothetical protein